MIIYIVIGSRNIKDEIVINKVTVLYFHVFGIINFSSILAKFELYLDKSKLYLVKGVTSWGYGNATEITECS